MNVKRKLGGYYLEFRTCLDAVLKRREILQKRKFLIFGQGRTGSTLLASMLDSHSQIYCVGEPLFHKKLFPRLYLHGCAAVTHKPMAGFHVKCYQLTEDQKMKEPKAFLKGLVDDGWKLIYLKRSNLFRHAVSPLIASKRNLWHVDNKKGKRSLEPVELDPQVILERIHAREEYGRIDRELLEGFDFLPIEYESDLLKSDHWKNTHEKLCSFLDVPFEDLYSPLKRTTNSRLEDTLVNFGEIRKYLTEKGYGHFIDSEG
jgi:LPS sulfotransferase NodH